jgi:hypothetical protein
MKHIAIQISRQRRVEYVDKVAFLENSRHDHALGPLRHYCLVHSREPVESQMGVRSPRDAFLVLKHPRPPRLLTEFVTESVNVASKKLDAMFAASHCQSGASSCMINKLSI